MGLFADRRRFKPMEKDRRRLRPPKQPARDFTMPAPYRAILSKPSIISSGRAMKFKINARHQRAAAKVLTGDYFRLSSYKLVEQLLRLLQIARVETFGEPAINRSKKLACFSPLALIAPEARHAHRRAEFPDFGLLLTCDRERALEIRLRFRHIRRR
jgi:hypothetical protein